MAIPMTKEVKLWIWWWWCYKVYGIFTRLLFCMKVRCEPQTSFKTFRMTNIRRRQWQAHYFVGTRIQCKSFWASQYANKPNQIFNPQVARTEILFIGLWPHHEVTFTIFPAQRTNIDIMLKFSFSLCEISIKTHIHTMSIDII